MHPFECVNKACVNLIKYKGLQIMVESMTGEADSFSLGGGWSVSFSGVPIKQKMNYNVTIRLLHNFSIDLVFSEDDFNPAKPWGVEDDLKLAGLNEDDRQVARFMYFFWMLSKYIKTQKPDSGPMEEFVFCRTKIIRRTL